MKSMEIQHVPMILTLADALWESFINSLLFSFSNIPFSTNSNFPYGFTKTSHSLHYNPKNGKVDNTRVSNSHLLFSSVKVNP